MPIAFISGAGQGGGGPISSLQLQCHMRLAGDSKYPPFNEPLVRENFIIHTDGAKAYAELHRMTGKPVYRRLNLWRTWVRHSRKKNRPVQFCRLRRVILADGSRVWRKGGTQKLDGYWALLRKEVARRGVRTSDSASARHGVCTPILLLGFSRPYPRCETGFSWSTWRSSLLPEQVRSFLSSRFPPRRCGRTLRAD